MQAFEYRSKNSKKRLGWRYKYSDFKTTGMNDIISTHIPQKSKPPSFDIDLNTGTPYD